MKNDEAGQFNSLQDDLAVLGAHSSSGAGGGHVLVFERSTSGVWTEAADFKSSDSVAGDGFGYSTDLVGDQLFVGAIKDDTKGSAYVFRWSPASLASRIAGTNPSSLSASGPPVIGQVQQLDLDLAGTTGHSLGALVGFFSSRTFPLAGGQTLLVNIADPAGEVLAQPVLPGPTPWTRSSGMNRLKLS